MSNLMHKVKDAISGHSERRKSSDDSSVPDMENTQPGVNNKPPTLDSDLGGAHGTTGNAQASSIHNLNPQSSTTGEHLSNEMNTTDKINHTTPNIEGYGPRGYNTGGLHNPEKSNMQDNSKFPSSTMDTTENQGIGSYVSGTRHGGSRISDITDMRDPANTHGSNKNAPMNTTGMGSYGADGSDVGVYENSKRGTGRSTLTNQAHETYGSVTDTGNSYPSANTYNSSYAGGYGASDLHTGQTGAYTSVYGVYGASGTGGKANDSNLSGSGNYNTRGEPELEKSHGQQGFGGNATAGGSSSNTQEPAKRRSSGPHSSNLLNKLDPRVKSSDYEGRTAGGQQRG